MTIAEHPATAVDPAVYKTLLESTRAIPWHIDWKTMRFTYVGPQIEPLLGWTSDSWVTVEDWASRIHPDDRERVVNFCVQQSRDGIDHEADYRALTKDGRFVWMRDVVHVVRESGETVALVGFLFDISERRAQEEKVLHLQRELEEMSFKDSLTGLANRRMFEQTIERDWAGARRSGEPLSLVLVDIDYFKDYNDCYGHVAGDDCLRQVARRLESACARPHDLAARFGGEEFALVLPRTDAVAAWSLADRCRREISNARMPHARSQVAPHLTVSMGVGTVFPDSANGLAQFIEDVDRKLYLAKKQGRDRVE